jgi:hypothetical protein
MLAPSVLNEDASTVPDTTGRGNRSGQFRTHLSEKYRPAPSRWASASVHEPSEPAKMAPRASGRLRGPRAASRRSRRVDAVLAHDRAKVDGNDRLAPLGAPSLGGPSSRSRAASQAPKAAGEAPASPRTRAAPAAEPPADDPLRVDSDQWRRQRNRLGPPADLDRPRTPRVGARRIVDQDRVAIRPRCRHPVTAGLP